VTADKANSNYLVSVHKVREPVMPDLRSMPRA
jgi:hypothetical protein